MLIFPIKIIDRKPASFVIRNRGKQEIKICTFPLPVPVRARSKACICGRSPAEDCGFESHRGHGCPSVVIIVRVVSYRSLRRADHSSRGTLPTVVRRFV